MGGKALASTLNIGNPFRFVQEIFFSMHFTILRYWKWVMNPFPLFVCNTVKYSRYVTRSWVVAHWQKLSHQIWPAADIHISKIIPGDKTLAARTLVTCLLFITRGHSLTKAMLVKNAANSTRECRLWITKFKSAYIRASIWASTCWKPSHDWYATLCCHCFLL